MSNSQRYSNLFANFLSPVKGKGAVAAGLAGSNQENMSPAKGLVRATTVDSLYCVENLQKNFANRRGQYKWLLVDF